MSHMLSQDQIVSRARGSVRVREVLQAAITYCVHLKYGYVMPRVVAELIAQQHSVVTALEHLDAMSAVKRRVRSGDLSREELAEVYTFELAYVAAVELGEATTDLLTRDPMLTGVEETPRNSEKVVDGDRNSLREKILGRIEERRVSLDRGLGRAREFEEMTVRARRSGRQVRRMMRRLDRLMARHENEIDMKVLDPHDREIAQGELLSAYGEFVRKMLEAEARYIRSSAR